MQSLPGAPGPPTACCPVGQGHRANPTRWHEKARLPWQLSTLLPADAAAVTLVCLLGQGGPSNRLGPCGASDHRLARAQLRVGAWAPRTLTEKVQSPGPGLVSQAPRCPPPTAAVALALWEGTRRPLQESSVDGPRPPSGLWEALPLPTSASLPWTLPAPTSTVLLRSAAGLAQPGTSVPQPRPRVTFQGGCGWDAEAGSPQGHAALPAHGASSYCQTGPPAEEARLPPRAPVQPRQKPHLPPPGPLPRLPPALQLSGVGNTQEE